MASIRSGIGENMRVEIEIPKEFECDFNKDRFKETFYRLSVDAHLMAGNYEKETLKMLLKAFENANVWADED